MDRILHAFLSELFHLVYFPAFRLHHYRTQFRPNMSDTKIMAVQVVQDHPLTNSAEVNVGHPLRRKNLKSRRRTMHGSACSE